MTTVPTGWRWPQGFRYDDATHRYYIGDRRITGITEALTGSGLRPKLEDCVSSHILERARARGTAVHALAQYLDEGDLGVYPAALEPYRKAYADFKAEWQFIPQIIEVALCHPLFFFAGRPDRGGLVKGGRRAVVELKTSDNPSGVVEAWTEFQVALQQILLADCANFKADLRLAVCLRSNGTFKVRVFSDCQARAIALGAVAIQNWKLNQRYPE